MTEITATPAKLKDGSWGVRFLTIQPREVLDIWAREGNTRPRLVKITTKAGKSWTARLSGIVSCRKDKASGKNAVLASTLPYTPPAPAAPAPAPAPAAPKSDRLPPVYRETGGCGCGEYGTLYGRYAPGMCIACWDERYS